MRVMVGSKNVYDNCVPHVFVIGRIRTETKLCGKIKKGFTCKL